MIEPTKAARVSILVLSFASWGCEPTDANDCPSGADSGTLVFSFTGAPPEATSATIYLEELEYHAPLTGYEVSVPAGRRMLDGDAVAGGGWPVRTAYAPTFDPPILCVRAGESHSVAVTFGEPVHTSGKLWFPGSGGMTGYVLSTSATPIADGVLPANAIAFDRKGDFWSAGANDVQHYRAADLARGVVEPHRVLPISVAFADNRFIAFDRNGALWIPTRASGTDYFYRYSRVELLKDVPVPEMIPLTNPLPSAFAFDAANRLWMSFENGYSPFTHVPGSGELRQVPGAFSEIHDLPHPLGIAFDRDDALWVTHWNDSLAVYERSGSARLITFPEETRNHMGPAFDEAGTLWTGYADDSFAGFSAAALATAGNVSSPSWVVSLPRANESHSAPAIFPAPRGVPLYHSLP